MSHRSSGALDGARPFNNCNNCGQSISAASLFSSAMVADEDEVVEGKQGEPVARKSFPSCSPFDNGDVKDDEDFACVEKVHWKACCTDSLDENRLSPRCPRDLGTR